MNLSPRWVELLNKSRIRNGALVNNWPGQCRGRGDHDVRATRGLRPTNPRSGFRCDIGGYRGEKPSVVQLRSENLSIEVIGRLVIDALREVAADLEDGALVTIDPGRTRVRVLPLIRDE